MNKQVETTTSTVTRSDAYAFYNAHYNNDTYTTVRTVLEQYLVPDDTIIDLMNLLTDSALEQSGLVVGASDFFTGSMEKLFERLEKELRADFPSVDVRVTEHLKNFSPDFDLFQNVTDIESAIDAVDKSVVLNQYQKKSLKLFLTRAWKYTRSFMSPEKLASTYEFKRLDVHPLSYSNSGKIFVSMELGLIGDEGSYAQLLARENRYFYLGVRGGFATYQAKGFTKTFEKSMS